MACVYWHRFVIREIYRRCRRINGFIMDRMAREIFSRDQLRLSGAAAGSGVRTLPTDRPRFNHYFRFRR